MFTCFYCSKQFSKKNRVKDHILEQVCLKKVHFCWCGTGCVSPNALQVHNSRHHTVRTKLNTISLNFVNFSEFESWKQSIEEETLSRFVKPRTSVILKNGNKKTKYVCHRSGKTRLKTEERQRASRKKGSCKLNALCPAFICIEEDMLGLIKGDYYGIHNHESDIQHLTISQKEKENIADCLNKGATFEEILDDIRNSSSNEHRQKRIHTLTRKDLHNIMQEFKISFKERLARDDTNIRSLVEECDQRFGGSSPIKLFKPQNVDGVAGMEGANSEDFILIMMSPAQKQFLVQCQHNKICVDSSHGIKGFDFHLTTILATNGSGSLLPVAFCLSNAVNENIMNIFFAVLNKECGNIPATVFTSKDFPVFVNSWCKVMSVPEKWQVDKNLSQNLQKMMINDKPDEITRTLVREMDDQLLTPYMQKFVEKLLENESTKDCGMFFVNEYTGSFSDSSANFEEHSEIHTNSKLEAMHRVLKDIYFKGLKVRRLDFSIFRLLKMAWDNLFERLTFLKEENREYTLKILKNRHDAGMSISFDDIVSRGQSYEVRSVASPGKIYSVEKEVINCSCELRCADCDTCLHSYTCSCVDFSIAGNCCLHVHAVSRFEKKPSAKSVFCGTEDVELPYRVEEKPQEKTSVGKTKQELVDALDQLSHLIKTNCYEAKVYEKGAYFIRKALDLFRENDSSAIVASELSTELDAEQVPVFSEEFINCDTNICEEASDQIQVEDVNLMQVDDVVEEIVFVDLQLPDDSYA